MASEARSKKKTKKAQQQSPSDSAPEGDSDGKNETARAPTPTERHHATDTTTSTADMPTEAGDDVATRKRPRAAPQDPAPPNPAPAAAAPGAAAGAGGAGGADADGDDALLDDSATIGLQKDLADVIMQAESFDPSEEQSIDEQIRKLEEQKQRLAAKREQTDVSLKDAALRANKIMSTLGPKMKEVVQSGDIQTLNEKLRLLKTQRTDMELSLQKVTEEIKQVMVGMHQFNLFRDIQEKAIKAEKLQKDLAPQPKPGASRRTAARDRKRARSPTPDADHDPA